MGDCVGAIAKLEPARDVVDDRLDGPVRQEEPFAHLGRVQALGEQLEDLDLALGQPADRQPAWLEHLALETSDLVEEAAEEIGRKGAFTGRR